MPGGVVTIATNVVPRWAFETRSFERKKQCARNDRKRN